MNEQHNPSVHCTAHGYQAVCSCGWSGKVRPMRDLSRVQMEAIYHAKEQRE